MIWWKTVFCTTVWEKIARVIGLISVDSLWTDCGEVFHPFLTYPVEKFKERDKGSPFHIFLLKCSNLNCYKL